MTLRFAIHAALAAGAFVALPAVATDSSDRAHADQAFTTLDKNNDGNIDQAEAAALPWLQQSFSKYDHDRDGKLGKDEFAEAARSQSTAALGTSAAAGGTASAAMNFDSLDKNNDGNIDRSEAAAVPWLQQNFSQFDHDRDGKLGKDEFREAQNAQPGAATGASAAAGGTASAAMNFESLDKNNDGNIDASEAAAAPWLQQNFSRFDHDGNGKLGKDEFREAQNAQPK